MTARIVVKRSGSRYMAVGAVLACPGGLGYRRPTWADMKAVSLLVDLGATHTIIQPASLSGVELKESTYFLVADGRQVPAAELRMHLAFPDGSGCLQLVTVERALVPLSDSDKHGGGLLGVDLLRRIDLQDGEARITLASSDGMAREWGSDSWGQVGKEIAKLTETIADSCGCEAALKGTRR